MNMTRIIARIAAPLLFVGCASVEIARVVLGRPWPGFTPTNSNVVGMSVAALWLASAFMVATGAKKALYIIIAGSFALLAHGVVTRAGGSTLGILYIALAPVVVLLERIALGSSLRWGKRPDPALK